MADPEQIYSEVLQEEQSKGVSSAVAEGRAKAARARAEHGSPHPKEPKWWPGAQPHLEGNGAAPAEAAEAPAEEEAAPEPAAEEPAPPAEAPAPAAPAEAPAPAAEAPAAPAATAPAAAAAPAATVEATATSLPPEQRPAGVTHGVPTGTRLRPEDEVQTDAQFAGQELVHERRRRIDEVVAAGAGEPAARGPRSGQWVLFLVYLAIIAGALFAVIDNPPASEGAAPEAHGGGGEDAGGVAVSAANVAFDTAAIELPADEEATIEFTNEDASSVPHNIAIYEDDSASKALFQGGTIPGGESTTYDIPALKPGTYYFQCDVHPGMNGSVEVG